MNFSPNKTPIEIIKKVLLVELILEITYLLIANGTKFMERICSFKKY